MVFIKQFPRSKKSYLRPRIIPEDWVVTVEGEKYFEEKLTRSVEGKEIIKLNSKTITELPTKLKGLILEIEKSKYILDLRIDEEDEKSDKYSDKTWIRAIEFISDLANFALSEVNYIIDTPNIYDGPDGSIDILWKKNNYRLLIKIPQNSKKPISLYGDDFKLTNIKGTVAPQKTYRLLFNFLHILMRCGQ